jgi:acetyl-CoA carboxylase biotin carboxylase subunit
MGDKTAARRIARDLAVPMVPGTLEALRPDDDVRAIAREVGYPVMLKAALGGGGKGMRLVAAEAELDAALRMARGEAGAAFGDAAVYLERYVPEPRHIEVQVVADEQGRVIHLGERECSIQRRHQKLIEESPSPFVDARLRDRLGEAACRIARAAGYVNAGTVEFLVDQAGAFYFLEMNTRLQVEHPVTELVTGLDLVHAQFRIAAGEPLGFSQADVKWRGAAIECRINAEDPAAGWLPSPGRITRLRAASGPWVRDDSGVYEGWTVPRFYDTLLAKLIVWGPDRTVAIERMARALGEYKVVGIRTTILVLQHLVAHADFRAGRLSTAFLERAMPAPDARDDGKVPVAVIAAVLAAHEAQQTALPGHASPGETQPGLDGWRRGVRRGWPGGLA